MDIKRRITFFKYLEEDFISYLIKKGILHPKDKNVELFQMIPNDNYIKIDFSKFNTELLHSINNDVKLYNKYLGEKFLDVLEEHIKNTELYCIEECKEFLDYMIFGFVGYDNFRFQINLNFELQTQFTLYTIVHLVCEIVNYYQYDETFGKTFNI